MNNVIGLDQVRVQTMVGDVEACALDLALRLRFLGYRADSTEAVIHATEKAEEICRARG